MWLKYVNIIADKGLLPVQCQAIGHTSDDLLAIGP